jgi:hypothetical protein
MKKAVQLNEENLLICGHIESLNKIEQICGHIESLNKI